MNAPVVNLFGPRDEAIDRQEIVDTLHRMLDGHVLLDGFPDNLKIALEWRVWERDRVFPGGTRQGPVSLDAFVRESYPVGLGASFDTVERLIGGRPDVQAIWEEVTKRAPGGNNNSHGRSGKPEAEINLYIVQDDKREAPTGNSLAAGLRKLQKAAAEGNDEAAAQLAEVVAGHKKVHTACVDAGLRKSTKIDADVKARNAIFVAEWAVAHAGQDDLSPLISALFGCGASVPAKALVNLVGEPSTMDRAGWGR